MSTFVVTGAAGFIGSHLARTLAEGGARVIGIDRRPGIPGGVTALLGDLAAPDERIRSALSDADAVWHLAALPGVRDPRPDVEAARERDNVSATAEVCALVPSGVPLVVTSSSSVYGGALRKGHLAACREDDPIAPQGGYALSKARAEEICRGRMAAGGLTCIVRPFTVAGEGQRPDMAISRWLAAAETGSSVTVFGSLERTRDLTDVRQVVSGLFTLMTVGMGRTVNLGTGRGRSLREILEAVFLVTGRRVSVEVTGASDEEVPATLADTSLLSTLLGWTPQTDLLDVIDRQFRTFRAIGRSSPERKLASA